MLGHAHGRTHARTQSTERARDREKERGRTRERESARASAPAREREKGRTDKRARTHTTRVPRICTDAISGRPSPGAWCACAADLAKVTWARRNACRTRAPHPRCRPTTTIAQVTTRSRLAVIARQQLCLELLRPHCFCIWRLLMPGLGVCPNETGWAKYAVVAM